jgi:CHAT domain-containing protein
MKYDTGIAGLPELRRKGLVSPKKSILSYFIGNSHAYAFKLSHKGIELFELPSPGEMTHRVVAFRKGIVAPWLAEIECGAGRTNPYCRRLDSLRQAGNLAYAEQGHMLYKLLIGDLSKQGNPLGHELVIIPDGVLGYLPFQALLVEKPISPDQFRNHRYLLRDHRISYGYSATLLSKMYEASHDKKPEGELLAMAPYAQSGSEGIRGTIEGTSSMEALPYSLSEIIALNQIWGGEVLTDKAATKKALMAQISDFRMIHLSTHAFANDRHPHLSGIALYPQDQEEAHSIIRLSEIYAMRIPAEMVVLSACESGLGVLQKGEGIISLARAFTYAGAGSIVTSLWSVQDRATSTIMASFYRHLHEGKPKDEALHLAQLDYLKAHDHRFANPFFWAGFVPNGNMEPLRRTGGGFSWWWVLVVGLAGIGVFVGIKRRKTKGNREAVLSLAGSISDEDAAEVMKIIDEEFGV